jgi:hypothetical protein
MGAMENILETMNVGFLLGDYSMFLETTFLLSMTLLIVNVTFQKIVQLPFDVFEYLTMYFLFYR